MTRVYNSELVQVWESPQANVVHYVPKESSKIIYSPKGKSDTITNSVWELSLPEVTKVFKLGSYDNTSYSLVISAEKPRILVENHDVRCPISK